MQSMPFNTPFCRGDLLAAGFTREQLDAWLANGIVSRHSRGVYLPSGYPEPLAPLSAAMFGGCRAAPFVVAAQLHGLWTPPVRPSSTCAPLRADRVHGRHLVGLGSLRLPSRRWTAVNLARGQALSGAVIPLDCALRLGEPREALEDLLVELAGAPGTALLAESLSLADGKVESALESFARGVFRTLRLPDPLPQLMLTIQGRRYRPDFAWPAAQLVVEVDGEIKYREQREIAYERRRQRELEAAGWRVLRLTWADLRDPRSPSLAQLRRLLAGSSQVGCA
jgi:hypothetical protein